MKKYSTHFVFNLPFFTGTLCECAEIIREKCASAQQNLPFIIATPNPEQIIMATRSSSFRLLLSQADLLLPDGSGIVAASKLFSFLKKSDVLPYRIAGSDLVIKTMTLIPPQKILVIGGRGYAEKSGGQNTLHHFFWCEGYRDAVHPTLEEEKTIQIILQKVKPSLVCVAFGAPLQEEFIFHHEKLFIENKVACVLAVGGAFDFITGKLKRAPKFVQSLHIEWLFRLVQEPWRWKRQLRLVAFINLTFWTLLTSIFFTGVHTEQP